MPAIEGFVERYREAVGRRFERLPVHLWPGQATEPQRLQRLFVPVEVDRVPTGLPSSRADLADGVRERATPAGLRDLVARHGALLLVGDAGSGKTTTLRQMALTAAEEGWGALPVYLRLGSTSPRSATLSR